MCMNHHNSYAQAPPQIIGAGLPKYSLPSFPHNTYQDDSQTPPPRILQNTERDPPLEKYISVEYTLSNIPGSVHQLPTGPNTAPFPEAHSPWDTVNPATESLASSARKESRSYHSIPSEREAVKRDTGAYMFNNAQNFHVSGGEFYAINNHFSTDQILKPLHKKVSLNAILNAGGRADEVRCHPGTRKVLIRLIEEWASDAHRGLVPRLCWLSGPAGAGKTALVQTIAERSMSRKEPQANFFFFRADGSRSTAGPLVATLLYQYTQLYLPVKNSVESALSEDPLLLDTPNIQQKFDQLIRTPLEAIRQSFPTDHPFMLIIDGLDECQANDSQQQIIRALGSLVADETSPFIVLLASRKEHHIEMAVQSIDNSVQRIFLDETYSPDDDIALFVKDEFHRIKTTHPLAGTLDQNWPSSQDIENIVKKSSGQFIYAATVMRFIADSRASPEHSLQKVQGIVPVGRTSPFSYLDGIYNYILSQSDDWEATYDLLAVQVVLEATDISIGISDILGMYKSRYSKSLIASCVSDLSAIVRLDKNGILRIYHKSLEDFLVNKERSGQYWIDIDGFRARLIEALWEKDLVGMTDVRSSLLYGLKTPSPYITNTLVNLPPVRWVKSWMRTAPHIALATLQKWYDPKTVMSITCNFRSHGYHKLD